MANSLRISVIAAVAASILTAPVANAQKPACVSKPLSEKLEHFSHVTVSHSATIDTELDPAGKTICQRWTISRKGIRL